MHNIIVITTVITTTTTVAELALGLRSASDWVPLRSAVLLARERMPIHTATPRHQPITRRPFIPIRGAAGIRNMAAITPAEPTTWSVNPLLRQPGF
jgi:hypothetical protein